MAADNMSLGRFRLEGIPPAPRGLPQVEVVFDIDANGILNVTARDKATGKEQKVTITASTNLEKSDIDRMVRDAREHESEDRRRKELVEARNNADTLAYQTEKTLRDLGDKVPEVERENIQNRINAVRQALESDDISNIQRLSEELQNALHALTQQVSAQQQTEPQGPSNNGDRNDEGEVVEGQFHEV